MSTAGGQRPAGRTTVLASESTFLHAYAQRRAARRFDLEALTFDLAGEIYGIDIRSVREIVKLRPITEVPRVPRFLLGLISVRGVIVPIVDLQKRLGLAECVRSRLARVLIVDIDGDSIGLLVDRVRSVVRMQNAQIEPAPLPGGMDSEFLAGVAREAGELIVLLNVAAVARFSLEERGGGR